MQSMVEGEELWDLQGWIVSVHYGKGEFEQSSHWALELVLNKNGADESISGFLIHYKSKSCSLGNFWILD